MQCCFSRQLVAVVLAVCCANAGAFAEKLGPVTIDVDAPPARHISDYRFFKDGARQIPNDGVVPYDLNSPLFSDYSSKHRFVYLPPGASAEYDEYDVFAFPVGAVILKTFGYLNDIRDASLGEQVIETRLLVHTSKGWVGLPYVWNENATEATLKVAGGTLDVAWIHFDGKRRTNNYIIPNMNQCKSCHEQAGALQPIGPKARNLNKDYPYDEGSANQLAHWSAIGYLSGAPGSADDAPRLAVWNDPATGSVVDRARSYLEINCMHCHNPDGAGNTTGLFLNHDEANSLKYGVMKPPVAAGLGSGGLLFDVVPGKPDESILYYRLGSTDPGVMMPELPRRLVDDEGLALVRDWILALEDAKVTTAGRD